MRINVQIGKKSEEVLKKVKRNFRGIFVDEAIAHFIKTPEGKAKFDDLVNESSGKNSAEDFDDSKLGVGLKEGIKATEEKNNSQNEDYFKSTLEQIKKEWG
jgi:hypothetical protein